MLYYTITHAVSKTFDRNHMIKCNLTLLSTNKKPFPKVVPPSRTPPLFLKQDCRIKTKLNLVRLSKGVESNFLTS